MSESLKPFNPSSIDAKEWAKEFVRLNSASDEGTMLAWFASAIMAGFDEANRRNRPSPKATLDSFTNQHKEICSSAAPITDKPCHICGAVKTNELVEALEDLIDTLHLHRIPEEQGCYTLVNTGEMEQAIERAMKVLGTPPTKANELEQAKEIIENLLIATPEYNGIWHDRAECFVNDCKGCPDCMGIVGTPPTQKECEHDKIIDNTKWERRVYMFAHKVGCDGKSYIFEDKIICPKCGQQAEIKHIVNGDKPTQNEFQSVTVDEEKLLNVIKKSIKEWYPYGKLELDVFLAKAIKNAIEKGELTK